MSGTSPEQGRRLLEEALRFLDLVQAAGPAAGEDRPPHGAPECRVCPVCRGMAYLREVEPEAVERLSGAAAGVAAAVRDLFGAPPSSPSQPAAGGGAGGAGGAARVRVQHIDVTD